MQGWVAIHRSILEHWLHTDIEKFGAWVDLILRANHEPRKMVAGDTLITIDRGQLFTSYRSLADKWGWSVKKIKQFLTMLETDKMLVIEPSKKGTLLTLVNYGFYQDIGNTKETQKKHDGNTKETQRKHDGNTKETQRERNNNDNNVEQCLNNEEQLNNDNNETSDTVTADASPAPKKHYGNFDHVRLTDEEYNKLCGDYGQQQTERAIDFLDAYIEEKGYKSKSHNLALRRWVFDAVKERDSKNRNKTPQQDALSKWGLTREDVNT